MSFARVLSGVIEEDDGTLLRIDAFEKMMEGREAPRGRTARVGSIGASAERLKRSRKEIADPGSDRPIGAACPLAETACLRR